MMPTRRDLKFDLAAIDLKRWNAHGPLLSAYMNTLSLFFPDGERFFIHSLRHYRDQISDPELKQQVTAFIGQEAMHGREHEEYNERLEAQGLPAATLGREIFAIIEAARKLPHEVQLSITIALEHFTAIYGDLLLRKPEIIDGSEPTMTAMWRWHALEETEHKAVTYDVYGKIMGKTLRAYLLRTSTLVVITGVFLSAIAWAMARMVKADTEHRHGLRDWAKFGWLMLGPVGALRGIALPWLDYFKPGFHPWDHDNRAVLDQIDALAAQYAAPARKLAPVAVAA
ncbi:MAG: metal-dependent hydrolase [Gammaproteobacteria bacterium]|uniref:metal-dependent hydrolase n=1 Tax=Nevskia sp. TaxID=1929292 RepID=UPI004035BB6A|nr:metal-dependent hydrolase [Gammaproteobacteria bacterium]